MKSTPKNLANSMKFNGILLIQTTLTEMQNNLSVFALSSTEETVNTTLKENVVNFSISCQILKLGQNMLSVVTTGNYIYDFLSDSEKASFQQKKILNLKKKFQKYQENKVKFHVLLEENGLENKEYNLELEPTHMFFDIDFFKYFETFFKDNSHIRFQSKKVQKPDQSFEAEIIKNISFVLFDIKKVKENEFFLENYLGDVPQIFSELTPMQGQTIYTVGSPYGVLSSELYKNMLHKGIISNVFHVKKIDSMRHKILQKYLFSLDMLVISGNEGGAILDEKFNFFGVLLPPLSLSNSDAKYISFGINYSFILRLIVDSNKRMLSENASESSEIMESKAKMIYIDEYLDKTQKVIIDPFEKFMSFEHQFKNKILLFKSLFNICLIMYKGSWASGIVFNRKKGLILTVSHLSDGEIGTNPKAFVKFANKNYIYLGKFIKKSTGSYDIGLIQIEDTNYFTKYKTLVPSNLKLKNDVLVSKTIYAVGYGVFTPNSFNYPMISKGIISKIIYNPLNVPKLIESDCKIFNGYSGGGLFTEKGDFIGMIVYNLKENIGGIRENINFSYHYKVFEELFASLKKNQVDKVLEDNEFWIKKDEFLEKAGELQTRVNVPIYKIETKL